MVNTFLHSTVLYWYPSPQNNSEKETKSTHLLTKYPFDGGLIHYLCRIHKEICFKLLRNTESSDNFHLLLVGEPQFLSPSPVDTKYLEDPRLTLPQEKIKASEYNISPFTKKKRRPSMSFSNLDMVNGTPNIHVLMVIWVVIANYDVQRVTVDQGDTWKIMCH